MDISAAFLLGLLGSAHCVGMCGPIALALPTKFPSRSAILFSRLLYNFGRIITYAILGLIAGLLGDMISLGGYQRILSIVMGVLILLGVLLPASITRKIFPTKLSVKISGFVKKSWGRLFGKSSQSSLFIIGLLNGFLPCGLVYAAMAASATSGGVPEAMMFMAIFGLGTFPLMLLTSLFGQFLPLTLRSKLNRLIPVGAVLLALLLILRGMALGIPYVSPKEAMPMGQQSTSEMLCH